VLSLQTQKLCNLTDVLALILSIDWVWTEDPYLFPIRNLIMFESTVVFKLVLLFAVFIVLKIVFRAPDNAELDRELPLNESEEKWGWWVRLYTTHPDCKYYFGPFSSVAEAESSKLGYVHDLEAEGAKDIAVMVLWCKPKQLTSPEVEPSEISWCA
jgi:Domain of unknown function (DUF1816)